MTLSTLVEANQELRQTEKKSMAKKPATEESLPATAALAALDESLSGGEAWKNELMDKPVSIRLTKGMEAVMKAAKSLAGATIQDICFECIQSKYEEVVLRRIDESPEAAKMMRLFQELTEKRKKK